jgi:hypothetical protein
MYKKCEMTTTKKNENLRRIHFSGTVGGSSGSSS